MYNRKKINNYLEIFIDSDILKNKKINNISRFNKNVVGIDIKPEYPMKPDIKIFNNFKTPLKSLANEIAVLINKKLIK